MLNTEYRGNELKTQYAVVIATFYAFFEFTDFAEWRKSLRNFMTHEGMTGTILLAPEGINATVAGSKTAVGGLVALLGTIPGMPSIKVKQSSASAHPFGRAKVRLKKELIPMGRKALPHRLTGKHADAETWNHILLDPETFLLDARNDYEVHVGTFKGAANPGTRVFSELPAYVETHLDPEKHKRIATFCTGGIRCEKLTSWLIEKGFSEVWQLDGGILQYLEDMPKERSLWQGECYVFDERVAVDHGLGASEAASMCGPCGHPLLPEDRLSASYIEHESCPYCVAPEASA